MTRAASSGKQRAVHFYIIDFFQGTNPKDKRSANSVWVCRSILYDFRSLIRLQKKSSETYMHRCISWYVFFELLTNVAL